MDVTPAHKLAASRMFLTQEDVDDIIGLVEKIHEEPVVWDLGAGSGTTTLAVFQTNPKATVYTVDIDAENLEWARKNVEAYNLDTSTWHGLHMTALAAAGQRVGCDLLLHDASHDGDIVEQDLRAWIPALAKGTMIWVHDYKEMPGAAESYPGVKAACDRLVKEGLLKRHKSTGIGFIGEVI